jgi:peptidyl-prolyl cis-trans isomerase C
MGTVTPDSSRRTRQVYAGAAHSPEIVMVSSAIRLRAGMFGLAAAFAAILAGSASAKVLAKVNGTEITDQDLAVARDDLGPGLPAQLQGAARDAYVLDYLIDGALVAQKAETEKLGDTPDFQKKLAYYREKLLMESMLGKVAKDADTDAAIQKTYDEVAKTQTPETEVHARHILVDSEDDAKKALQRVKDGEDFGKVATEISKDPGSKGGDLGWFTKDRMVPEFADAAFKLQPGQISDPVKSQFGWHIIRVDEKREKKFPPLGEIRDQVARYVVQKAQSELIVDLRKTAKIERMDQPADAKPGDAKPGDAAAPAPDAAKPDASKK